MSRRVRASRDPRVRRVAALGKKMPTLEDLAWWSYRNGFLVDEDIDYLEPAWLTQTTWDLAAVARSYLRIRDAGLDLPPPVEPLHVLGQLLSLPPEQEAPPELVQFITDIVGAPRAVGRKAIGLRNFTVFARRAMGGPDGRRLRAEIFDGKYDPAPVVRASDPTICPLSTDLVRATTGCVCRGGTTLPTCIPGNPEPPDETVPSISAHDASHVASEVVNRGQARSTTDEHSESVSPAAVSTQAAGTVPSLGAEEPAGPACSESGSVPNSEPSRESPDPAGLAEVDLELEIAGRERPSRDIADALETEGDPAHETAAPVPYSEPSTNPPPPPRKNRNHVPVIGSPIRPGRTRW